MSQRKNEEVREGVDWQRKQLIFFKERGRKTGLFQERKLRNSKRREVPPAGFMERHETSPLSKPPVRVWSALLFGKLFAAAQVFL